MDNKTELEIECLQNAVNEALAPAEYFLALVEQGQATAADPRTLGRIGGALIRLAGFDLRNLVVEGADETTLPA